MHVSGRPQLRLMQAVVVAWETALEACESYKPWRNTQTHKTARPASPSLDPAVSAP